LITLNRWSGDRLIDDQGFFIYLRDAETGIAWSATPKPRVTAGRDLRRGFAIGQGAVGRRFSGITTRSEAGCSDHGSGEVRRLELANRSDRTRNVEVTSFLEVGAASPGCRCESSGVSEAVRADGDGRSILGVAGSPATGAETTRLGRGWCIGSMVQR